MINIDSARDYVTKIHRQMGININIMNEKGIIIASGTPTRIGDFHLAAYELIKSKNFISTIQKSSEDMIGVEEGVNLLLVDRMEPIGVVGVTGNPDEVMSLAKMTKLTMESFIFRNNTNQPDFIESQNISKLRDALLFEQPINPSRIFQLATKIGLRDNVYRATLIVHSHGDNSKEAIQQICQAYTSEQKKSQDILIPIDGQHLVLLKSFPKFEPAEFKNTTQELCQYFDRILSEKRSLKDSITLKYYCSIPTDSLIHYRNSYDCLNWLEDHVRYRSDSVYFINDYVIDYMISCISPDLLKPIFDSYRNVIDNYLDKELFHTTTVALSDTNMSPTEAAKELFVHKNTVLARAKKFKEYLGIQPLSNTNDAILLRAIDSYMSRYH